MNKHSVVRTFISILVFAGCGKANAPASSVPDAGTVEAVLKTLPGFQNPPVDARLKTRFSAGPGGASMQALQELAKSGFGAVELGINLTGSAAQASLATTLQAAKTAGMTVDLAPGGSQPYSSPGIPEAYSMQQLKSVPSALLISDGTLSLLRDAEHSVHRSSGTISEAR